MKLIFGFLLVFLVCGCASKKPIVSYSFDVAIKTKNIKFSDKGFVTKFPDHIRLEIYNAGVSLFDIDVYENKICNSFACQSISAFNDANFPDGYEEKFLKNFLDSLDESGGSFEDLENKIKIIITKEEL